MAERHVHFLAKEINLCELFLFVTAFSFFRKNSQRLVVCPVSVKYQWQSEIEKFSSERALVVTGTPEERARQYKDESYFFFIS